MQEPNAKVFACPILAKKSSNLPIILQKEECKFAPACEIHFSFFSRSKLKFNFWKLKSTAEVFDPVNFTLDFLKSKRKFSLLKGEIHCRRSWPCNFNLRLFLRTTKLMKLTPVCCQWNLLLEIQFIYMNISTYVCSVSEMVLLGHAEAVASHDSATQCPSWPSPSSPQ